MKIKPFFFLSCLLLLLTGCSSGAPVEKEMAPGDSAYTAIGSRLEIQNLDSAFTLRENMDTLSADGLYYASWSMGNAVPYVNSEGENGELYDAQLHLLLGEVQEPEKAREIRDTWLEAAKTNYIVTNEELITCNEQAYTLLTYDSIGSDSPHDHGLSAFGAFYDNAVCVELTWLEEYAEESSWDFKTVLLDFLNCCSYKEDAEEE